MKEMDQPLKSEKVRHDITLLNGEVDNEEDPLATMYFNIEVENKTSSQFLIQHGYNGKIILGKV